MFSKNSEKIYITIAAFFTVFLINYVFFLHAWNPPTAAPTGGNIELLNVGSDTQFKTGALGLGGNSKTSGIKINSGGATEPTCNVNTRGLFWSKSGGVGEEDELIVCLKNSDDEYVWEKVEWFEFLCGEDFTDPRDSKVYSTVDIGGQCWMSENLNYDDGCSSANWVNNTDVGWCGCYDGTSGNCDTYGLLYQWSAAMADDTVPDGNTTTSVQGICPEGWSLPSDTEQHTLDSYLADGTCDGSRSFEPDCDPAGAKLAGNFSLWAGDLTNHSDFGTSGFEGLPGGYRWGDNGSFGNLGSYAYFWSSSSSGGNAWGRYLDSWDVGVDRYAFVQAHGFSVRCLRD